MSTTVCTVILVAASVLWVLSWLNLRDAAAIIRDADDRLRDAQRLLDAARRNDDR